MKCPECGEEMERMPVQSNCGKGECKIEWLWVCKKCGEIK